MVRVHAGPLDLLPFNRGCSSVGRAPDLHSGGRRFDPCQLHKFFLFFENWELMSIHKCESSSAKNAEGGNFIL